MAKKEKEKRVRHRRDEKMKVSHRRKERELHLIPDLFATAGTLPILNGNASGSTPWEQYKGGAGLTGVMNALEANATSGTQLKEAAILEVIAWASKVIGKKLGLNKVGTKGVRLF